LPVNGKLGKPRKSNSPELCRDLSGAGGDFVAKCNLMKRWAVLTVLLYALALLMLTLPVIAIAFANWGKNNSNIGLHDVLELYMQWAYWVWLGILVGGQFLLLLLPIHIAERRLPARRPLKIPVIVTGFFLANLFIAAVFSVLCVAFHDGAFRCFEFVDRLCGHVTRDANGEVTQVQSTDFGNCSSAIIVLVIFWILWAFLFRRFAKMDDEQSLLKRATRWLLRGSILELLIAVPSHVIVRRRDDCCAPMGTFWGIATGISVMLLCFGPGVFFLFVERMHNLKPKPPGENQAAEQK
jgi:hypothetical protein